MNTAAPSDDRFRCDRLRVTLTVEACAGRWRRVFAGELSCTRCRGCPIGARNAGAQIQPAPAQRSPDERAEPRGLVLDGVPLSVIPDRVIAARLDVPLRSVTRARIRSGAVSHSVHRRRMRAAVECRDLATARRLAQETRTGAIWAGAPDDVPQATTLDPRALWAVFSSARSAAAAAAGVRVAPLALPTFDVHPLDRVEWSEHPVGLLPDELVARVVDRSRRQVTRVASTAWVDVLARVWRAAALRQPDDLRWLEAAVEKVRAWALDWCPPVPPTDAAPQLALGLPVRPIVDQTPPDDPVALAHYYNALVAHCRRALREEM